MWSGPDRLKAGRRTSQAEGSEDGPVRLAEGSESGPDWLKARGGGPVMLKTLRVILNRLEAMGCVCRDGITLGGLAPASDLEQ